MKRKMLVGLVLSMAAVVMVLGLGSCDVAVLLEPYAYVYDASGDGLAEIVVGLFPAGTTNFTTTTPSAQGTSSSTGYVGFGTDMATATYVVHVITAAPAGQRWALDTVTVENVDNTGAKKLADFSLVVFAGATSGKVVDSRTAPTGTPPTRVGVASVALTITNKAVPTQTFTTTTAADGTFTFYADPGEYTLTGVKAGYFIAPKEIIAGTSNVAIGDVQGFSLLGADYGGLSFILVWNGTVQDVDIHMTFPITPAGSTAWIAPSTPITDPNYLHPALGTTGRNIMSYLSKSAPYYRNNAIANGKAVYMDVDATTGYGPETMNLVMIPNTASVVGGTNANSVDTGFGAFYKNAVPATPVDQALAYYGSSVVYLNAFTTNSNLSNGTGGAEARVYVIQTNRIAGQESNSNPTDTQVEAKLLGIYSVPLNTSVPATSVCRVNMFIGLGDNFEYFQIVPEMSLIAGGSTAFRGGENAVINAKARAR